MAEGFFEQLKKKNKAKGRLRKSKACTSVLIENGKKVVREVDYNSRQAVILQFRLLNELLKENQNTEYGKKYDFANIHSIEEYKKKVPFAEYDDLQPYIYEMMAGEKNVLSSEPPMYYATTTGSIGVPKHIPVSERELKKYNKYSVLMAFGVAEEYYRNTTGMTVPAGQGLNAIEMKVTPTKSGVNAGSIYCTLMDPVKDIVPYLLSAPWEVINPGQEMDLKYLKTRLALQNKDLAFMDSVFLCGLVDLMDYIKDNYEMLCEDIAEGKINEFIEVPDKIREVLKPYIVPDPERAQELRMEFAEGFEDPIIPRIWPRMSWIGGIGTGAFFPYVRRMREYTGKSIPFNNLCYAASESFMAVARHMGDTSYVLLPDGGFYEFIPVNAQDETKTLNINELEVGEDYEVVVTNLSGFYRYRIRDVVKVTGYYNETPILKFIYRRNQLLSLAGEKTSEEAIRWAIEVFSRDAKVDVNDYSIFPNRNDSPMHYTILIEPSEIVPKEKIPFCRDTFERCLIHANPTYGEVIRNGGLAKLDLVFLQQETYRLYREMMIMKGASANQLKPVRIIDNPLKEKFFFNLKERYED